MLFRYDKVYNNSAMFVLVDKQFWCSNTTLTQTIGSVFGTWCVTLVLVLPFSSSRHTLPHLRGFFPPIVPASALIFVWRVHTLLCTMCDRIGFRNRATDPQCMCAFVFRMCSDDGAPMWGVCGGGLQCGSGLLPSAKPGPDPLTKSWVQVGITSSTASTVSVDLAALGGLAPLAIR
jgi:hypothetical protein